MMDEIVLNIPKKKKQELIEIAHKRGLVLNEYIWILINNRIEDI